MESPTTLMASLLTLILSSLFPVSALVYLAFQREKKIHQLEEDLRLLGIADHDNGNENPINNYLDSPALKGSFFSHSMLPASLTIIGCLFMFYEFRNLLIRDEIYALRYGFLGAFVYSIQLLYRRYTTFDLQPAIYLYCAISLIAGLAFNFTAASFLPTSADSGELGDGISAIASFSLGYFPLMAIRWFNRISNSALGNKRERNNSLPLSVIDGISQFHETRLREEGIDNVQNLASAKIDELLANTRFSAQQVMDWVDQAILHTYIQAGSWESFRRGGVRMISDFQEFWKPYYDLLGKDKNKINVEIPQKISDSRRTRAMQLQSTPEQLDSLYLTTATGPNIAYIETYWQNLKAAVQHKMKYVLDDNKKEVKSIIQKTQIHIFKEIGKLDLFDQERHRLGEIVKLLTKNPDEIRIDDQAASFFIGCGWWLWQLTKANEENHSEKARQYYIRAEKEEESARLFFELSLFYAVELKESDAAIDYANKSIQLCEKNGNQLLLLQVKTVKEILHLAAGQDDGKICFDQIFTQFDSFKNPFVRQENTKKLNIIISVTKVLFEDNLPSEFIEFDKKIKMLQEESLNIENNR